MADFLLLIRSGKTAYDLDRRIQGSLDLPLAAEGLVEAAAFAGQAAVLLADGKDPGRGKAARLWTSSARSARETAAIIGRRIGLKPRDAAGLENLDHGLWQGLRVEEIEERQPRLHRQWRENPWSVAAPEGELLDECCERVAAAIERLSRREPRGAIVVVVPGPLDRIIRWVVAAEPLGDLWQPLEGDVGTWLLPMAAQWSVQPRPFSRVAEKPRERSGDERLRTPFFKG